MVNQLISPNLHVVILHAPLGLLFTGLAIEVFSFLGWRRSMFRLAGRWMILIGALLAVPTVTSGMYALRDVTGRGIEGADQLPWRETVAESKLVHAHGGDAWEHLVRHAWLMSISTGVLLLVMLVWLSSSDRMRGKLHFVLLLLTIGSCGAMAWGAWDSGEAVYRHSVGVEPESDPHEPETAVAATSPASAPVVDAQKIAKDVEYFIPPMQTHVMLAGLVVSLSIVALGLSIRNSITQPPHVGGMDDLAMALGPAADDPYAPPEERRRLTGDDLPPALRPHYLPASRFWLLATLAGVVTALLGYWVLARAANYNILDFRGIWEQIRNPDQLNGSGSGLESSLKLTRRLAHVLTGSSIVVLTLLLAIFTRIAPRKKVFVLFLGLLLLAAIAAQVWLGTLLLFDTNSGTIRGFN